MNTLSVEEFEQPAKRWSFANLQVQASRPGSPDRFWSARKLEPLIPESFTDIDINGLLDGIAFDEMTPMPVAEDPENNQQLREMVRSSSLTRLEVSRLSGIPISTLHNYMTQPHHGKFRKCPDKALQAAKAGINAQEK